MRRDRLVLFIITFAILSSFTLYMLKHHSNSIKPDASSCHNSEPIQTQEVSQNLRRSVEDLIHVQQENIELKSKIKKIKIELEKEKQTIKLKKSVGKKSIISRKPSPINWNYNFVIPIVNRTKNGYSYLEKTMESISKSFKIYSKIKISFHLFGFEKYSHPNFYLLDSPKKENLHPKTKHTIQFVEMMKKWKPMCSKNNEIFILLEDDFEFCETAVNHLIFVHTWAQKHMKRWSMIRTSMGLNGLILPCFGIPGIIEELENLLKINPTRPHDSQLIIYWKHTHAPSYTYHLNLFLHIGHESAVQNVHNRAIMCLHILQSIYLDFADWYQEYKCGGYAFSPCHHIDVQSDYNLNAEAVWTFPGNSTFKNEIMKELGVSVHFSDDLKLNCEEYCKNNGKKCHRILYDFANSAEVVNDLFHANMIFYDEPVHHKVPKVHRPYGKIFLLKSKNFDCLHKTDTHTFSLICPCIQ